jgi:hypothetical protein
MKNLILTRLTIPELRRVIRQELILALSEYLQDSKQSANAVQIEHARTKDARDGE